MKHKLLKIANDLNKLILHSDEEVKAEFRKNYEGEVDITIWHYSQKYESDCNHLNFYEFFTDKELQRSFELAKDVIAGECLINE
ncbi:hypothetical protein BUY66_04270 [Staphylococcus epidermidis]|uniref:hypothetical protein n=1 Tax=Staphylococcus epidermidis TaxID=1282 RepID=UPI000D1CD609|nr:hypothetical protein [Staphylococcus epidermidis]MCG2344841.1 hypothetical protein [Staphylococcus epidermidis]PTE55498.1 hypothetical protein BUY66_04270 [Staphylococcus epidermidis]